MHWCVVGESLLLLQEMQNQHLKRQPVPSGHLGIVFLPHRDKQSTKLQTVHVSP